MRVRMLEDFEKKEILPLYENVFDDSKEYVNYFYKNVMPKSSVFTCSVNGETVGMLCLIPKNVSVGDIRIACRYIYGVATRLEWRKKGVMSRIMKEAVNHLYMSGTSDYFTYLIPSPAGNAAIYEKYGFGTVMDKVCETDKTDGVFYENNILKRRAVRSDIGCLSEFATAHVSKSYNVYLTKDKSYFESMFSLMEAEGGGIDIYFAEKYTDGNIDGKTDGKIAGYRIGFDDETVEEIYDDVLGARNRKSQTDDKISPYIMARILNISKMIPLMRTVDEGEIFLNVEDSVIDENNGVFLWRYGDTCSFERTDSGSTSFSNTVSNHMVSNNAVCGDKEKKQIIHIGIGELASHIFGYNSVAGLPEMCVKKGVFINDYV